jgi:archaellum component FlaF (FlaF/FlaG flagellin family)
VEPGTVTCCFTARQTILNVYINGVDVTAQVQGDLTMPMEGKIITFPEPAVRDTALAFIT